MTFAVLDDGILGPLGTGLATRDEDEVALTGLRIGDGRDGVLRSTLDDEAVVMDSDSERKECEEAATTATRSSTAMPRLPSFPISSHPRTSAIQLWGLSRGISSELSDIEVEGRVSIACGAGVGGCLSAAGKGGTGGMMSGSSSIGDPTSELTVTLSGNSERRNELVFTVGPEFGVEPLVLLRGAMRGDPGGVGVC